MEFIPAVGFGENHGARQIWEQLRVELREREGFCYYKYPRRTSVSGSNDPHILIVDRNAGIIVIDVAEIKGTQISSANKEQWILHPDEVIENPTKQTEDNFFAIQSMLKAQRDLREGDALKFPAIAALVCPFIGSAEGAKNHIISNSEMVSIFFHESMNTAWTEPIAKAAAPIPGETWHILKAVLQGTIALRPERFRKRTAPAGSMGAQLEKVLDQIAALDTEQEKIAIQIPEGPQRIRGLAGSGKTIVLAMKAAWMHHNFPDYKILCTFNSQSLYGQYRQLITNFYRHWALNDPNWERIQVMHAWGGKTKVGVYSSTCKKIGVTPMDYRTAKRINRGDPFSYLCNLLLEKEIPQEFDAVLIDEAQDFDHPFFRLVYKLLKAPKRVIWAFDEIQSLNNLIIPSATELFGVGSDGKPLVDLSGVYDGGIEKDFILHKCYRNPREILMLAHGYGLGIARKNGPLQMLPSQGAWNDIGYQVLEGEFRTGSTTKVRRPIENSPSLLSDSKKSLCEFHPFATRKEEIEWVASKIENLVKEQGVKADGILVIHLDAGLAADELNVLQLALISKGVNSIIPGDDTERDVFTKENQVTLSHIYRAKGNEASVVFAIGVERVADTSGYDVVTSRNMAFTAISRSKGWVFLSGKPPRVSEVFEEMNRIIEFGDTFSFKFPDMDKIRRRLDTIEYERRRRSVSEAKKAASKLADVLADPGVVDSLPEELKALLLKQLSQQAKKK